MAEFGNEELAKKRDQNPSLWQGVKALGRYVKNGGKFERPVDPRKATVDAKIAAARKELLRLHAQEILKERARGGREKPAFLNGRARSGKPIK